MEPDSVRLSRSGSGYQASLNTRPEVKNKQDSISKLVKYFFFYFQMFRENFKRIAVIWVINQSSTSLLLSNKNHFIVKWSGHVGSWSLYGFVVDKQQTYKRNPSLIPERKSKRCSDRNRFCKPCPRARVRRRSNRSFRLRRVGRAAGRTSRSCCSGRGSPWLACPSNVKKLVVRAKNDCLLFGD